MAIESALRSLGGADVEVKTRGLSHLDLSPFARWPSDGRPKLTLVLTRIGEKPGAILCQRCSFETSASSPD
jgi:hypothetical protein